MRCPKVKNTNAGGCTLYFVETEHIDHEINYRPQRSCGKVMFSQACVKNSLHSGGSSILACTTGHMTRGSLSRGSLGVSVQGVSVQGVTVQECHCPGGLCPGGFLSRVVSVQGGLCPGRSLSRVFCLGGLFPRGSLSGRPPGQRPPSIR